MTEENRPEIAPVWCAVANIVMERDYGPRGAEKRSGTKHFSAGAKVYILYHFWGMGGEQVTVVGRHRGSHRYVTMTIASKWLTNWRTQLVYSPHMIKLIEDLGEYPKEDLGGEAAKNQAEEICFFHIKLGAKQQPFLTRTSRVGSENMSNLISPTGAYEIFIKSWEPRMSLWVQTPEIIDRQSQEIILAFRDDRWSLEKSAWIDNTNVQLTLRKYPGNHLPTELTIAIDCQNRLATMPNCKYLALSELEEQIDLLLHQTNEPD
jgi:hypothetical protein